MPDIATALKNAIAKWEPHQEQPAPAPAATPVPAPVPHRFQPTSNVSRTTFETIKANAGMTSMEAVIFLALQGFNKHSVSSLITQMVNQGMVRRDENHKLYVTVPEYRPIKSASTLKNAKKAALKAEAYARRIATRKANAEKKKQEPPVPAPAPAVPAPAPAAVPVPAPAAPAVPMSAETILNSLTVLQAKELYARLKEIFGT